ncbi:surfeit locus protein 6-domain-containing protein [Coniella lustricola]|uniref:Surfeit locus protein 6-domain-containing protein n=1 Tax=Coniella lustricola TaxID=2025994 RepID=A0A2T2ZZ05_9PEZI|nr:surfeit locus protein 6-domain-containing protein [Coniella lustricola]
MADDDLKVRLRTHSEAFDSLLSLIPAKLYYGEDTSDQWQRKKQSKEEARAAKRGRLDPDSALNRTAKEVMDERARNKRKVKEMEEDDEESEQEANQTEAEEDDDGDSAESLDGIEREQPGEGLKKRKITEDEPVNKKARHAEPQKENGEEGQEADEKKSTPAAEKLSSHQEKKLLKMQKKADKKAEKKKTKGEKPTKDTTECKDHDEQAVSHDAVIQSKEADADEQEPKDKAREMRNIDTSGLADNDNDNDDAPDSSPSSTVESTTFDAATENPSAEQASTTTSIASDAAGTAAIRPSSSSSKKLKVPSDTTELRARLAAKIAALRAARKADGPDGAPIRTRQELIESRRKKQAERKAHKKELWKQTKEAEDKKREEALASARNSPMLSFGSGSPEHEATSFSFGRVTFADGTQMSQDLSYVKDKSGKKRSTADPKGALAKLEAQKKRLAGLDADKRKEVLEKETWLAARKRAEGEKVRNDESLLKKAVKRKEKIKKKSQSEWTDRVEGVKYAQKQRQQKREDNIRKRKEAKTAGKGGKKKGKGPTKKRPGFEGSGFGGKKK